MNEISPTKVFERLSESIPKDCHDNILIIGSLAAGYHFYKDQLKQVRTKDVDCVIIPRSQAIISGQKVTDTLLNTDWHPVKEGDFSDPGNAETPDDQLPAVRHYPPNSTEYFVELLTVPELNTIQKRSFTRIKVPDREHEGKFLHYGLPSFRYLILTQWKPINSSYGIHYARPSMMALANLLEHPTISDDAMSKPIGDQFIKRSNKDLGRVIALASLTGPELLDDWAHE